MLRILKVLPIASLVLLFIPAAGWSQEVTPGARDHAPGFFLRMAIGGGYGSSKNDGLPLEFKGAAGEFDIAIGGTVTENLALHGTIFGWAVQDPDVEGTLTGGGTVSGTSSGTADMTAAGGGITYYFMPVNIYVSASAGVGTFSADGDVSGESDSGFAGQFTAGKEWWVGNRWGLGVSGVVGFFSLPEPTSSDNWKGWNFSVMFSATLN